LATTVAFAPLPGALISGFAPPVLGADFTATVCAVDLTFVAVDFDVDLGAGVPREAEARAVGFALAGGFLAGFLVGLATEKPQLPFVVAVDTFVIRAGLGSIDLKDPHLYS